MHAEVSYNEGWNIYAAQRVAQHQSIYPATYQWTTVNYPMLSFALMASLHRFTHEYLFTGRIVSLLSLLACGFLVATCVRLLGGSLNSAILAGLFCVAVFCASLNEYVGVDDPQILANAVFLLGLALYLYRRRSLGVLTLSAFAFTVAISIKHSPIEFVLAVMIDLAIASLSLATWFAACGLTFGTISFALHLHYGGHGFLLQVLAPRAYTASAILDRLRDVFGPLLVPVGLALVAAYAIRHDPRRRILSILIVTSLVVGGFFAGGHGVSVNCLFGGVFTMCMLLALLWDRSARAVASPVLHAYAPAVLFLWLLIPMGINEGLNPAAALRAAISQSNNFQRETELIRERPGPALCESLLACYEAGKPFIYDPFNATRLIAAGKLDPSPLLKEISSRQIPVIQFDTSEEDAEREERIPPAVMVAIRNNYQPLRVHLDAGVILVPK